MSPDLEEKLFAIKPEWFDRNNSQESLMCFGFECQDGWYNLLRQILLTLVHHAKEWEERVGFKKDHESKGEEVPDWLVRYFETYPEDVFEGFRVDQVKEKFAMLRFYTNTLPDNYAEGVMDLAGSLSGCICEVCGGPSKIRSVGSWLLNRCEPCWDKELEVRAKRKFEVIDGNKMS